MKVTDVIIRAGRNLRQAKARTLLTSLAISVGAFTVSLALAAGAGGRAYVNQIMDTSGDARNLSVYAPVEESDTETKLAEYGVDVEEAATDSGFMTPADMARIKGIKGVDSVTPSFAVEAAYVSGEDGKKLIAPLRIKSDKSELIYAAGSLDDYTVKPGQAVLPESYIEQFGFEDPQDAIGKVLTLHIQRENSDGTKSTQDVELKIAAVDKKADTTFYYQEVIYISPEDGSVIHKFATANTGNADEYYGASAQVAKGADVTVVQSLIEQAGYQVYSLQDSRGDLLQSINIVQWGMAGFGFLAILASIFGIINTQYISVLERTSQIGLMKALGARRKDIGRLFRYEAAWVGLIGGVMGVGLAGLVSLFNPMISTFLNLDKGTKLLLVEPATSILLIAALMTIAVGAGYFPARKAAKLDPIEALRTE